MFRIRNHHDVHFEDNDGTSMAGQLSTLEYIVSKTFVC